MAVQIEWFKPYELGDPQGRGYLVYRLAPGHAAEIVDIKVRSDHRRTGVGRTLVERMLAALPNGVGNVFAWTRATNYIAQDWYEALRFVRHDVSEFYGDDDPDAVLYVRRLRA